MIVVGLGDSCECSMLFLACLLMSEAKLFGPGGFLAGLARSRVDRVCLIEC